MKHFFITGLMFLLSGLAVAQSQKTYHCPIIDSTAPDGSDEWSAEVNLKTNTVKLSSLHDIHGVNPFATLTLAPAKIAKQHLDGMIVFAGNYKSDSYVLAFNPANDKADFEAIEQGGRSRWVGEGICLVRKNPTRSIKP